MRQRVALAAILGLCAAPSAVARPAQRDPIAAALAAIDEPALMADVAWLTDPRLEGRGFDSPTTRRVADRIEREFRAAGLATYRQPIPGAPGQTNVIGVLSGSDEVVIVCAHYDGLGVRKGQVYPGADDNASGVAVLLSLARAVGRTHRGRTVVFLATGAEEDGLLGAKAYVDAPVRPLERTRAVLNFDMVGRRFLERVGRGRDATFAVVGMESDPALEAAVSAAAAAEAVTLVPITHATMKRIGADGYTDDWFFRNRRVPSVRFTTGDHRDYHRPTDTVDRLTPAQMLRVARVATRALVELAGLSLERRRPRAR